MNDQATEADPACLLLSVLVVIICRNVMVRTSFFVDSGDYTRCRLIMQYHSGITLPGIQKGTSRKSREECLLCVRNNFVPVIFLQEHLHCARSNFVPVNFLQERLLCVRRLFVHLI